MAYKSGNRLRMLDKIRYRQASTMNRIKTIETRIVAIDNKIKLEQTTFESLFLQKQLLLQQLNLKLDDLLIQERRMWEEGRSI